MRDSYYKPRSAHGHIQDPHATTLATHDAKPPLHTLDRNLYKSDGAR